MSTLSTFFKHKRSSVKERPKHFFWQASNEEKTGDSEQVQIPFEASMARLIVYCISVPYKHGETNPSCCEMHSFSENQISTLVEKCPLGKPMFLCKTIKNSNKNFKSFGFKFLG